MDIDDDSSGVLTVIGYIFVALTFIIPVGIIIAVVYAIISLSGEVNVH